MFGNPSPDVPENGEPAVPFRLLYPVPEVAQLLGGITEREVWRMLERKQLKARKIGRRRLVHRDDLTAFIAAHDTEPAA